MKLPLVRLAAAGALLVGNLPLLGRGAEAPAVLPLWPGGAPGFESRRDEPEQAQDYWVKNI
ncbi:MAG TPA: hypothetical protein VEQ85_06540, partial [Lacipirellulaceae bacterium]|nr:hypothetical protein [Lacipirellulaceae bacterium]